jgi:hypothetical protein
MEQFQGWRLETVDGEFKVINAFETNGVIHGEILSLDMIHPASGNVKILALCLKLIY